MDFTTIIGNLIFIILSVVIALFIPQLINRVGLISDQAGPILQAILIGYAIIFCFIVPVSGWLINRGLL